MTFTFNSASVVALLSVAMLSACSDSDSSSPASSGASGRDGAAGSLVENEGGDAGETASRAGAGNVGGANAGEAGGDSIPADAGSGGDGGGAAEPGGAGGTAGGGSSAGTAGIAGTAGAPPEGPLMIPCDVNVIYGICQNCHSNPTLNEAPFPLVTLDDMQPTRLAQIGAVSSGSMPKDGALSPSDKTRLLAWLNAGAKGVPQASCQ